MILAQASDATAIQQVLVVVAIIVSIAALGYALAKARQALPVRPLFDGLRLIVQIAAVVAMARLSGVTTAFELLVGAGLLGVGLGALQGNASEAWIEQGKTWSRRSPLAIAIWGGGLVLMQAAGLANRAGLVQVGQAVAWMSIGATIGMLIGRQGPVGRAVPRAAACVIVIAGAIALTQTAQPAFAQSDEELLRTEFMADCQAQGGHNTPSFGSDCARAWPVYLAGIDGQFEFCFEQEFSGNDCQRYYDAILMSGQSDLAMLTCETPYSQVPSCLVEEPDTPSPSSSTPTTSAQTTTTAAGQSPSTTRVAPTVPAPPRTSIVTEDIDPDRPPAVVPIPDEGEALIEEEQRRRQEAQQSSGNGTSSGGTNGAGTNTGSGSSGGGGRDATVAPLDDTERSEDPDEPAAIAAPTPIAPTTTVTSPAPEDDAISGSQSLEQAIAAMVAAGVIGIVTWAEAMAAIDAITRSAAGTAQQRFGYLEVPPPGSGRARAAAPAGSAGPPGSGPGGSATQTAAPPDGSGWWNDGRDQASPTPHTDGPDVGVADATPPAPGWWDPPSGADEPVASPLPPTSPAPTPPPADPALADSWWPAAQEDSATSPQAAQPATDGAAEPPASPDVADTTDPAVDRLVDELRANERLRSLMPAEDIEEMASFARDRSASALTIRPRIDGFSSTSFGITARAGTPLAHPHGGFTVPITSDLGSATVRVVANNGRLVVLPDSPDPGFVETEAVDAIGGRLRELHEVFTATGRGVDTVTLADDGSITLVGRPLEL